MTRKYQPRLQCIRSATGENLTEAAQIGDRWKGCCEDVYHEKEGKRTEQKYWDNSLHGVKTDTEIADKQAGFRQGRGTRDQITNLRILMHKAREHVSESH